MRRTRWCIASLLLVGALVLTDRQRQPRPPHQAELLQAGETRVRTLRAGAGDTTLVLLHGYGDHLLTWRGMLDPLAARHRVIAFDLPGFGGSEKPDRPYTLGMMAREVAGFLDRWTRGPLILVGHSMGGAVAARVAMDRPDLVEGLVLIAPAGLRIGLGPITHDATPARATAIGLWEAARAFVTPVHDPEWMGEPPGMAEYNPTTDPAFRRSTGRAQVSALGGDRVRSSSGPAHGDAAASAATSSSWIAIASSSRVSDRKRLLSGPEITVPVEGVTTSTQTYAEGYTTGEPFAAIVLSAAKKSQDYQQFAGPTGEVRPGHTDLVKYHQSRGFVDIRGGGRSSYRSTISDVVGGAIARIFLEEHFGTVILSSICQVGPLKAMVSLADVIEQLVLKRAEEQGSRGVGENYQAEIVNTPNQGTGRKSKIVNLAYLLQLEEQLAAADIHSIDANFAREAGQLIKETRIQGDSVGAAVEVVAVNNPPSAVMSTDAWASLIRSRRASAEKPPNTTECTAPIRAQASMAMAASGTIGR